MQRLRIARLAALTAALPLIIVTGPALAQTPQPAPGNKAQPDPKKAPPKTPPGDAKAAPGDKTPDGETPDGKTPDGKTPDGKTPDSQAPPSGDGQPAEPTAEELERARTAFMEGRRLFDAADYDNAVEQFKEAYRLSKNPLLLYNIGFTHDKRKDMDLALFYYDKFMKDAGEKAAVYDEVKKRVEAIKKAKEQDALFNTSMGSMETGSDTKVKEFMHKPVEEAAPGYPLDVTVFIPEGSGWQVTLFYRAAGEERFDSTLMKKRYNEMVGRIPKAKTRGKTMQYYIEVRDKNGAIIQRSGRSASPNLVFIETTAKPRFYPDVDSEGLNDPAKVNPGRGDKRDRPEGPEGTYQLGPIDMSASTFRVTKWATTGAAAVMLAGWIASNREAARMGLSLEGEADRSTTSDDCPSGNPCRSFSQFQKDLQSRGENFERLSYVALGLSVVTTGLAGYMWYKELTRKKGEESLTDQVTVVPVVSQDYVGSAATLRF